MEHATFNKTIEKAIEAGDAFLIASTHQGMCCCGKHDGPSQHDRNEYDADESESTSEGDESGDETEAKVPTPFDGYNERCMFGNIEIWSNNVPDQRSYILNNSALDLLQHLQLLRSDACWEVKEVFLDTISSIVYETYVRDFDITFVAIVDITNHVKGDAICFQQLIPTSLLSRFDLLPATK